MQSSPGNREGTPPTTPWRRLLFSPLPALLVLLIGLAISSYLATDAAQRNRERTFDRFKATAQQTTRVMQEKIDRFSLLLMAGRGLILNNQPLPWAALNTRWHRMFDSYGLDYAELGIVGLSFTRHLPAHEREAFVTAFNREGERPLEIFPPARSNQPSLVVMHLVPRDIERRMLGYDLMSEQQRRQAVLEAMRSGQMVLSPPLSLLPTDINSLDYLQMLPVRSLSDGQPERFLGLITIGFSMSRLISDSLDGLSTPLRIRLFDPRESLQQAVFDSHPQQDNEPEPLSLTRELVIGQQALTLRLSSLDPAANASLARRFDTAVLTTGLSITLLLSLALLFFILTRRQALLLSQRMAARAEEMHQRYRTLFSQSPEAIVVHVDGRVELANRHAAKLFGYPEADDLLQRPITELVHPDSMELVQRRRAELRQGVPLEPIEEMLVRANGQPFAAEVSSSLINFDGREAVQVIFRDISDEKRQRLEGRIAGLLLEATSEAVMVTDAEGRIELVNPAFQRLTGYSEKAALGRRPDLLNAGHHSSEFFYGLWSSVQQKGYWSGDIINRHRDGRLYIQQTSIHALRNDDGRITHFVGLMRDVTRERESFEPLGHNASLLDPLTRLPTRLPFHASATRRLTEAGQRQEALSLLLVRAQEAADGEHGISPLQIAEQLRQAPPGSLAARLSANEFVLLTADPAREQQLAQQLQQIVAGSAGRIGIALGVARYPVDGGDISTLLLHAAEQMKA